MSSDFKIGIGFSQDIDQGIAAQHAAIKSKKQLNDLKMDIAIIFYTPHYDPKIIIPIIYTSLNKTKIIGSSTAGIILSDSAETRGIAVLTISSSVMKIGTGLSKNINNQDAREAGQMLAQNCQNDFGKYYRHAFVFFIDSLLDNNSAFLKGVQDIFGTVFPIIGAGSSDNFLLKKTNQIFNNMVYENSATGILLGDHIHVGVGGKHGWKPLGKPRIIDEVDGNIIKKIDGQKAFHLYEKYFENDAHILQKTQLGKMAILYPLGIPIPGSDEYLLRNAVKILPDGSIVCQGDIPEGAEVHLMIGNKDSCKESALAAAVEARSNLLDREAKLIIVIESWSRLKLLGRFAYQEINKIQNIFGNEVPIFGMYSHGEICPLKSDEKIKKPHLQNESITILAIC